MKNNIYEFIETYLTDNIHIRNDFFENLRIENNKDIVIIDLFYCYHLLKRGSKKKAHLLFKSIKENQGNKSLYLMLKAIIYFHEDTDNCKKLLLESIYFNKENKWSYLELFYLLKELPQELEGKHS